MKRITSENQDKNKIYVIETFYTPFFLANPIWYLKTKGISDPSTQLHRWTMKAKRSIKRGMHYKKIDYFRESGICMVKIIILVIF